MVRKLNAPKARTDNHLLEYGFNTTITWLLQKSSSFTILHFHVFLSQALQHRPYSRRMLHSAFFWNSVVHSRTTLSLVEMCQYASVFLQFLFPWIFRFSENLQLTLFQYEIRKVHLNLSSPVLPLPTIFIWSDDNHSSIIWVSAHSTTREKLILYPITEI